MTQELRKLADAVRDAKTYNELLLAQTKLDDSLTSRQLLELLDRLEKAEKDAERCKRFIDAMCEETFDTWTNGYRMQQVAMNVQHAMNITAAMEGSK